MSNIDVDKIYKITLSAELSLSKATKKCTTNNDNEDEIDDGPDNEPDNDPDDEPMFRIAGKASTPNVVNTNGSVILPNAIKLSGIKDKTTTCKMLLQHDSNLVLNTEWSKLEINKNGELEVGGEIDWKLAKESFKAYGDEYGDSIKQYLQDQLQKVKTTQNNKILGLSIGFTYRNSDYTTVKIKDLKEKYRKNEYKNLDNYNDEEKIDVIERLTLHEISLVIDPADQTTAVQVLSRTKSNDFLSLYLSSKKENNNFVNNSDMSSNTTQLQEIIVKQKDEIQMLKSINDTFQIAIKKISVEPIAQSKTLQTDAILKANTFAELVDEMHSELETSSVKISKNKLRSIFEQAIIHLKKAEKEKLESENKDNNQQIEQKELAKAEPIKTENNIQVTKLSQEEILRQIEGITKKTAEEYKVKLSQSLKK